MITKKYSVPIYKSIGTHLNTIQAPKNSSSFLTNQIEYKYTYENDLLHKYRSEINSILATETKIEITSNTLGILGTNVYNEETNEPYYYSSDISELIAKHPNNYNVYLSNILSDYRIINNLLYTNVEASKIMIDRDVYLNYPVLDCNSNTTIKVRKLKNKFKISIDTIDKYTFKLKKEYLLSIEENNSTLYFNQSILMKQHTFKVINKQKLLYKYLSIHDNILDHIVKDSYSRTDYDDTYYRHNYDTLVSNLIFNVMLGTTYVYLDLSNIEQIRLSSVKLNSINLQLLCTIDKNVKTVTELSNPYKDNIYYPLNMNKLWYIAEEDFFNVPFNKSCFRLNLEESLANKTKYLNNLYTYCTSKEVNISDMVIDLSVNTSYLSTIYNVINSNPTYKTDTILTYTR